MCDVVIIGAGPAGLMAAITAARAGARVRVLEAGPAVGRKLLASGGGRCNLTNTLPPDEFMARCGRHGRFMAPALAHLDGSGLRAFMAELGVATHAPDGLRVFPTDHRARTVLTGLTAELDRRRVAVSTGCRVTELVVVDGAVAGVRTGKATWSTGAVILASGGCGYPALGGDLSGCELAAACGHAVAPPHPGMVALHTHETWPSRCTADTIPRAVLRLRRPGKARIEGRGDLLFTREGLAGPVVLDLAREITPLLDAEGEQELELELTGCTEPQWQVALTSGREKEPRCFVMAWLGRQGKVAPSLAGVMLDQADVPRDVTLDRLGRKMVSRLSAALARLTVTVTGHAGWDHAMVMRGGVRLKDVRPETLESRRVRGLFLAGEVLDLDGPCGGFNLQWAFASGHLAGSTAAGRPGASDPS